MKAIQSLKAALAAATPDWSVVQAGVEGNFGGEHIEIHDGYGRTATVYGDLDDPETIANANLIALAQNHMADLLDAVEALAILREAYLNSDPKLSETLQGVLAGDVVSCLMERLASGRKAPEVECVEVAQQARVQVFQGYFGYEGTQLNVEFQAPVGATVAEKDAAFMAALAQQADIDYHAVGESNQSTPEVSAGQEKSKTTYYIWHNDGCCDNKTDDLEEARRIEKELLDDGYSDVYITDDDNNVVNETYAVCSFCEKRAIARLPQSTDQGKTVSMVNCCEDHREGWWDGADWDGRHLEVELEVPAKATA